VQRQQPRITIAWENANIADVLAQFAAYSGRTIIPARGVTGTITAEIIDKPWDVAMRAILNANGFDAQEDENGIIVVNTIENLAARPRYEALTTRTVRFNYTRAEAVALSLQSRLSRDCGVQASASPVPTTGSNGTPLPSNITSVQNPTNCPIRGAVTADTLTNSISITESPSNIDDIVAHALTLDIRQPQVNIKAKIILVDRTQLEELGLKYDLGSQTQHFNDVIARVDSTGSAETGNRVALGGNAISAIANAGVSVGNPTLRIAYSTAIGGFDFTTFLDAIQQVSLLDVQAEPSVTTLNYKTANLSAGTEVPVRMSEPGTGGNANGNFPQVTVQMRQTGIVLNVTPSVTNNRQVLMRVHAENSDVQFQGGDVGATFPTQSIDNELLVADGETAVMGGLTQTSVRVAKTGIPMLMDLPLIGRLFSHTSRQETKRDLLILITPHIVDEGDMQMSPRRSP
jgi:type IV pilus assembly protein PilQ